MLDSEEVRKDLETRDTAMGEESTISCSDPTILLKLLYLTSLIYL